jgi:transposase
MLTLSPSVPIYLHSQPIDMRKSFDGLFGIIKSDLSRDVRDEVLFMFLNQRLNRIKILYWDTDGIAIQSVPESCSKQANFMHVGNSYG